MKIIQYTSRGSCLDLLRRVEENDSNVMEKVRGIVDAVKRDGDSALREFSVRYEKTSVSDFRVSDQELAAAAKSVSEDLKAAISIARSNIERFHSIQLEPPAKIETMPGVTCWRKSVGIERVGLYVAAGTAPLFSTVLMLAVPANLAGCREVVICTAPNGHGEADPTIVYTAGLCGVSEIYKIGGAQAIAAMAFGTESIRAVHKIFGPGNSFVTCAKRMLSMDVAIDMPAGPSEVAILADTSCNPRFVAADLLSQAEHGPTSQVILVSPNEDVIRETLLEVELQLVDLPRRDIAKAALENSAAILVGSVTEGLELLNDYAPEHLILAVEDPESISEHVINAGSVFLGNYSCESAGDYASGTNHTLPTAGFAKAYSGLSVDSFVRKITFQSISVEGLRNIGPTIETMAAAEGLDAHKRAVSIRLEELDGD